MKLAVGVQGFGEFEGTDGHRQKTDHLRRVIRRHGGHHTIEEAIGRLTRRHRRQIDARWACKRARGDRSGRSSRPSRAVHRIGDHQDQAHQEGTGHPPRNLISGADRTWRRNAHRGSALITESSPRRRFMAAACTFRRPQGDTTVGAESTTLDGRAATRTLLQSSS